MAINASVTNQQITATVGETQIDVTVSGGVGPTGSTGPAGPQGPSYTLPVATASVLGGVKIGSGISVDGDGVISASAASVAWNDITGKPSTFSPSTHTHTASAITDFAAAVAAAAPPTTDASLLTSGTLNDARLSGNVVLTGDARLSDARTPSAHKASHATGGTDALSPADIGAASASHAHSATDVTSGTFDVARLPVGTGSTQVAAGNHTHTQLHDRSHAMTGTSDHTATNWRLFHSDGSGQVVELAFGNSGQALISNGASSAPSWGSAGSNSASDLTTGTLAAERIGAHASSHQTGGTDAVTNVVSSPSQITGNQNDYSLPSADVVRLSANAAREITGFAAAADGRAVLLVNVGSNNITLKHQSTSSTAANRIIVPWAGDCIIPADSAATIAYDNTTARWRVI